MNAKIEHELNYTSSTYPPMIRDILKKIKILELEFNEIVIWYGDGFDCSTYGEEESTLHFNEGYLLKETSHNTSIYIPYDSIYEIIIDYNQHSEGE